MNTSRAWIERRYKYLGELGRRILSEDYSYCPEEISEAQCWRTILTGCLSETEELDGRKKEEIRSGIETIGQSIDSYVTRFRRSLSLLRELKGAI